MAGSEAPEQEGAGDVLERDSSSWDWHGPWIHQYGRRKTKSVGLFLTAVVKTQLSIYNSVLLAGISNQVGSI